MVSRALLSVLGANALAGGSALRTSKTWLSSGSQRAVLLNVDDYSFEDFVAEFKRPYEEGSEEWNRRKELFTEALRDVVEFNKQPARQWWKGITRFMDFTPAERKKVLGYTGSGSRGSGAAAPAEAAVLRGRSVQLPAEFSVERPSTKLVNLVRDQGNCGSCWAEAATAVLEGQLEANATLMAQLEDMALTKSNIPKVPTLSSQAMVSCTRNEKHCGGTGGCEGATVELGYDMIKGRGGIPFARDFSYQSGSTGLAPRCRDDVFPKAKVSLTGYEVLPSNRLLPLKQALVQTGGPIAVSVDATNWFVYSSGVYSDKDMGKGDFTVNHAVSLMGYKDPESSAIGYWVIKNSWGEYWGEGGKIRLEMKENEEEHCGWDYKTHDGIACDGDPNEAWVCGTCGILYDSVYPTGVHLKEL